MNILIHENIIFINFKKYKYNNQLIFNTDVTTITTIEIFGFQNNNKIKDLNELYNNLNDLSYEVNNILFNINNNSVYELTNRSIYYIKYLQNEDKLKIKCGNNIRILENFNLLDEHELLQYKLSIM